MTVNLSFYLCNSKIFALHISEFYSLQFSCSVMFDFLRPPWTAACQASCPSSTPRVYPNSSPLSRWSHPTISSFVVPFSSCPQSFSASGSFAMSQLFASGGQSTGASASASVIPMNIQGWFPLGLTGLVSWMSKGLFKSLLQHHSLKASILWRWAFFMVQLSHLYMLTRKTIALTI